MPSSSVLSPECVHLSSSSDPLSVDEISGQHRSIRPSTTSPKVTNGFRKSEPKSVVLLDMINAGARGYDNRKESENSVQEKKREQNCNREQLGMSTTETHRAHRYL